jgi:hypothetical protein
MLFKAKFESIDGDKPVVSIVIWWFLIINKYLY